MPILASGTYILLYVDCFYFATGVSQQEWMVHHSVGFINISEFEPW